MQRFLYFLRKLDSAFNKITTYCENHAFPTQRQTRSHDLSLGSWEVLGKRLIQRQNYGRELSHENNLQKLKCQVFRKLRSVICQCEKRRHHMQPFSSILLFVFVARYLRESQILEDDDKLKTSLRFKYTFTVI